MSTKMYLNAGEFDDLFPTLRYLKEATEIVIAASEVEKAKLATKLSQMPAVATVSFETPETGEARYKIQEFLRVCTREWLRKNDKITYMERYKMCSECSGEIDTRGVCYYDCLGIDADENAAYEAACMAEAAGCYYGERHGKTAW
jgi:hypothetical protein